MKILSKDQRRGSALVLVMMMSVFTMGLWAVSFRITRDAIDTEGFHNERTRYEQRVVKGLAWAGEMLKDGQPHSSRYSFLYAGRDAVGNFHTRVEIRTKGDGEFAVTARPAKTNEIRRLPKNPTGF
ncbi:MAG: hypothetical protein ACPG31_08030 [Planctomycetota bacterium]